MYCLIGCDGPDKKVDETNKYVPASEELFAEIVHMDSVMFDAFNAHNLEKIMSTSDSSLEFYHDIDGVSDFQRNQELLGDLFERNKTIGLRRERVPGSMEVYPIKDYGAIETVLIDSVMKKMENRTAALPNFYISGKTKTGDGK